VATDVIHRVVETQALRHGDRPALVDHAGSVSYRSLNSRANALARALMCAGLRRSGHAVVTGQAGVELAVALLAVLKAGASYTWRDSAQAVQPSVAIRHGDGEAADEYLVTGSTVLEASHQASPNLPVLVRGGDTACIVDSAAGPEAIPHARIAACAETSDAASAAWTDDPTGAALWLALMTGTTLAIPPRTAAAA
jgi:non-ribosomal peptide synthetase component F